MYATCLFCHAGLGANDALERFPVGRRLAFDAARGRLWVICPHCRQWCLAPLDERWEAVEDAERLFRDARLRVATGQVGLARMRDGTDLVRIGDPLRPELAAWRYGSRFGARWRRRALFAGASVAAVGGYIVVGPIMGLVAGGFGTAIWNAAVLGRNYANLRRVALRIEGAGEPIVMTAVHAGGVRIDRRPDAPNGWALRLPHVAADLRVGQFLRRATKGTDQERVVTGDIALAAARQILPHLNAWGGRRDLVARAVSYLERDGSANATFANLAGARTIHGPTTIASMDAPVRLALEMAAHEESERLAMEGELAELEAAWREAEEIAAIADDLTLPERVSARLARLRG